MSLALMVCDLLCFEDLEEKDRCLKQSVIDGGVCRTAPATPGLLNMQDKGWKINTSNGAV